jgi:UDP-2,3-diacylglucosamine pyrophosphatase LpxH
MKEAENNDSDLDREPRKYRALFISDLHLGSKIAKADFLLDFLREHEAETIYLVGDIVDGWRLQAGRGTGRNRTTTSCRNSCARRARAPASSMSPGNHDEFLRDFHGTHFGGIEVVDETASMRRRTASRYLVIHGDQFDTVVPQRADGSPISATRPTTPRSWRQPPSSTPCGAAGHSPTGRSRPGRSRRSSGRSTSSAFQRRSSPSRRRRGVDGVICGHIHSGRCEDIGGIATSTPATGSKAARPSSSISTDGSNSSIGRCKARRSTANAPSPHRSGVAAPLECILKPKGKTPWCSRLPTGKTRPTTGKSSAGWCSPSGRTKRCRAPAWGSDSSPGSVQAALSMPQIWEDPDVDMAALRHRAGQPHRHHRIRRLQRAVLSASPIRLVVEAVDLNPTHVSFNRLKIAALKPRCLTMKTSSASTARRRLLEG